MKRFFSLILAVLLLPSTFACSEGLLPSLTDTFGVDMPSMAVYLEREPDEETTDESGTVTQVFSQVTENHFDGFNKYLEENGCSLADFSVNDNTVTETIEKQGKTFVFTYDNNTLTAVLDYPLNTNPGKYESINNSVAETDQIGKFSFSPETIQKYSIHQEKSEEFNVGDYIRFGRYEQDNNYDNGPEEIIWEILDIQDDKALLVSEFALEYLPFEEREENAYWATCSLRKWLNADFYTSAFTEEERYYIWETPLSNLPNPKYGTYSGENTVDYLFLFSSEEANHYWKYGHFFEISKYTSSKRLNDGGYWLRTTGALTSTAMFGSANSYDRYGDHINSPKYICPCMWVSLNNTFFRNIWDDVVYLTFGTYEQDNVISNGPEPIEWQILTKEDEKVLVVSRYAIDCQKYNGSRTDVTWETSPLRVWLNNNFLKSAFTLEEKDKILLVDVNTEEDIHYKATPGNNLQDQVFLLSSEGMFNYFSSDPERQCRPTAFAIEKGSVSALNGATFWWLLRSNRISDNLHAACVEPRGSVFCEGYYADNSDSVRPAMWITIED